MPFLPHDATALGTDAATIRVMVVDDSAVVRGLIARQLGAVPGLTVVTTAANGALALAELERREVDVVVLDVEMPVMDGLAALAEIHSRHPTVKVVMASTSTRRNAEISLKALRMGASDYVAKPEGGLGGADAFKQELAAKVQALGAARRTVSVAPPASPQSSPPLPATRPHPARFVRPAVIAIGASTGGPPALLKVFEAIKGSVEQPILLTQHMPAAFTGLFAEQLMRAGDRPCAEGRDEEPVLPGRCYVAPGGWHMTVESNGVAPVIRLNQDPPENFCRPAVDPMLRSVARVYGPAALTLIMTGMGTDGARGAGAVIEAGGRVAVQDEATSVVWGMPGAVAATGAAECLLPLDEVGPWLARASEQRT
jgi:two-component system chemotaxis response regulator CheB